jgi:hypothetical protein
MYRCMGIHFVPVPSQGSEQSCIGVWEGSERSCIGVWEGSERSCIGV